jgi:hypothetical protein
VYAVEHLNGGKKKKKKLVKLRNALLVRHRYFLIKCRDGLACFIILRFYHK